MSTKLIVAAPKKMKKRLGTGDYLLIINPQSLQPEEKEGGEG